MIIKARPISDIQLIASTVTNPRIWSSVSDDASSSPEDFKPIISSSVIYLGMFADDEFHGLFMLHQHNAVCWEVHTCLLPIAWGKASVFAAACVEWVFNDTDCQRLITNVPEGNLLAKRLAMSAGMQPFGINHKSFLKNGILLDQTMLGISKE